jgi:glutamate dehydrogenase
MEKMGLRENRITKFQTGGPDGDLGSNEILISRDKTVAIVDGSGVACDPEGLDRRELRKLARKRQMIRHFNRSRLSPKGFLVQVEDNRVKLPNGEIVPDGTAFRNTFHLRKDIRADFFIPCGGRPKSIHIGNWTDLLDEQGRLRFKYIVEGANLFITQAARLRLEEKGAVIYKDASANKGGVTSSSLEVFASLAMSDRAYEKHLCVKNGKAPAFREKYVKEVLQIIRQNAVDEFDLIWREHERSGIRRSVLSDLVSAKINALTDEIQDSTLFENEKLRGRVIADHCPPVLLKKIGMKDVLKGIPESYLRAVFASRLASRYVYTYGLESNEINFLSFIEALEQKKA